ncbi:MAG: flagellar export protein FliJ [Pseudomonadota bacterium]
MKSRETLIKLRRFEVDEKRQKVADIEMIISEFHRMSDDLERQVKIEQERAGVSDINHYAYPTFAKAALQRRENLIASITDLKDNLKAAQDELALAFEELKKVEMIEERTLADERNNREHQEQSQLDEFSARAYQI